MVSLNVSRFSWSRTTINRGRILTAVAQKIKKKIIKRIVQNLFTTRALNRASQLESQSSQKTDDV